jgi:C-terminal processing protease CtpA/Prc
MSVIPSTPTAQIGVQPGDLIIRINGEPVERWDHDRYTALLATADRITCTFLSGTQEYDVEIPVFDLVP